jgi:hypothetical protein
MGHTADVVGVENCIQYFSQKYFTH